MVAGSVVTLHNTSRQAGRNQGSAWYSVTVPPTQMTSEVAATVEGRSPQNVDATGGNYVDSHGQPKIGFSITRQHDVDLLANESRPSRAVAAINALDRRTPSRD